MDHRTRPRLMLRGILQSRPFATALAFLVAVSCVTAHGQAASSSDKSRGSAARFPTAEPNIARYVPYLGAGMAIVRPEGARYVDGEDSGHAALYGNEDLFDAGAFDTSMQFHLVAGVTSRSGLRAQLEVSLHREFDWRGSANYPNAGKHQPSEGTLDARQLMLAGFYDFPGWTLRPGRVARPYLGAGVGINDYRVSHYVQRFPDPDDPAGYLRRSPGGEIPFTAIPDGEGQTSAWVLTAGIAVPIFKDVHLDLSYRYTNAGEIGTDVADITIVRYRRDGTPREIVVPINETTVDYRTRTMLISLRFDL